MAPIPIRVAVSAIVIPMGIAMVIPIGIIVIVMLVMPLVVTNVHDV